MRFDPIAFFTGHTTGEARLKILLRPGHRVTVDSHGVMGADGVLTLTQRIQEERHPARTRVWKMKRESPTRISGTLSDARGPVRIETRPGEAIIRYTDKGGSRIRQRLRPTSADTVANHLRATRFGIPVAYLTETIRKLD